MGKTSAVVRRMTGQVRSDVKRHINVAQANARCITTYFFKDERGDTNFISILILLGIALGLAATFLLFRDQIVDWINKMIENFTGQVSTSQSKNTSGLVSEPSNLIDD